MEIREGDGDEVVWTGRQSEQESVKGEQERVPPWIQAIITHSEKIGAAPGHFVPAISPTVASPTVATHLRYTGSAFAGANTSAIIVSRSSPFVPAIQDGL